jgi:hypothetical protein
MFKICSKKTKKKKKYKKIFEIFNEQVDANNKHKNSSSEDTDFNANYAKVNSL